MGAVAAMTIMLTVLVTAIISGIFGMAGGLILMGVLTALMPISMAMIFHGAIQLVSNGWRAFLLRDHISWSVFGRYLIGGVPVMILLAFLFWRPDKNMLYILLSFLAFLPWLPKRWFALDVKQKYHAEALGFVALSLNTLAGVVGPVIDIFFVKSDMTRKEIVATKGATQAFAHLTKAVIWSLPALYASDDVVFPPVWLIIAAIPLSMIGTWIGGLILHRMSDVSFRDWTKWLLTAVGIVYACRAVGLL
ncbi:TSUP family transporter [Ponticaulis profundi]|uniref:Probable membrane transporter protein n=1 Tax=Ponticaulis profundi TaxID=2665222 RepID=A0ABW1S6T5_9PROT